MPTIVGYPFDKSDNNTEEKAPFKYEESANVSYDLTTSTEHMLQYKISTFAGKSMVPPIRMLKLTDLLVRPIWFACSSPTQKHFNRRSRLWQSRRQFSKRHWRQIRHRV